MHGMGPVPATPPRTAGSTPARPRQRRWTPVSELEFVGCDSCRMTLAEYENHPEDEPKIEFFDSAAGRAWMLQDGPSFPHEVPIHRLAVLVDRIAMTRGSPIQCRGAGGLRLLDADARQVRAIHPDQLVFLRPELLATPPADFLRVGQEGYPDVVLEVDHTTDIRRSKLKLYEEWGFPELWVEVPDAYSPSRPRGRRPGLRIYLLEEPGRYGESETSEAFPGWRAEEIHRALNELVVSPETSAVLARVGRTLGKREGTSPADDPLFGLLSREQRAEGRAEGIVEGRAAGIVEGRAVGRAEGRAGLVRTILAARGLEVPPDFPDSGVRAVLAAAADEAVLGAASTASGAADFCDLLRKRSETRPG